MLCHIYLRKNSKLIQNTQKKKKKLPSKNREFAMKKAKRQNVYVDFHPIPESKRTCMRVDHVRAQTHTHFLKIVYFGFRSVKTYFYDDLGNLFTLPLLGSKTSLTLSP